jgi:hypothetical protein
MLEDVLHTLHKEKLEVALLVWVALNESHRLMFEEFEDLHEASLAVLGLLRELRVRLASDTANLADEVVKLSQKIQVV